MTLAAILTLWALHLAAVASPGPAFAVGLRLAAVEGMRVSLIYALGVGLGGALWALAALAGLNLIFEVLPFAMIAMKIAGGLFLIWLGVQSWRHAGAPVARPAEGAAPRSAGSALRLALMTQIANPKTALFFGAIFAALVPAGTGWPVLAGLLALVFVTEFGWFALIGLIFSRAPVRQAYERAKTVIDRLFGAAMVALGLRLATQP